eukprot:XP_028340640.1 staphylococcal nuclease domain-containing protein 1-like [Physeter catodon]
MVEDETTQSLQGSGAASGTLAGLGRTPSAAGSLAQAKGWGPGCCLEAPDEEQSSLLFSAGTALLRVSQGATAVCLRAAQGGGDEFAVLGRYYVKLLLSRGVTVVAVAQGRSPPLPTLGPCCRLTPPVSAPQVEVEVEGMDKAGNFIGWLHIDGANLSVLLVEHALSKVHFTAERSSYYKSLLSAEEAAKQKKEKVWAHYELQPVEEVTPALEEKERSASYKPVFVTEITDGLHFYVQDVETGTQLEKLMENMRNDIASHPPVEGSYAPRRGEFCIAKFVDGEWYRARVEKVESPAKVHVFYIDYGNREILPSSRLGTLPPAFSTRVLPAQATEYAFAFIQVPQDEDARTDAVDSVVRDIQNTQCLLNVEHLSAGCPHVTLQFADSKGDVGLGLVKEGLVMVEVRKEKQFQKVITEYLNAQESAKSARLNLWRYGDFRADDADEFGYSR